MPEHPCLKEFYAVTVTSVYRVSIERDALGFPIVEKIAIHPHKTETTVPIGTCLKNGWLIGVGKYIFLYSPYKGYRHPDYSNTCYRGGRTSLVVALFLEKEKALTCSRALTDPKSCDPLHWEETKKVLNAIGDDHPVFVQPESNDLRLQPVVRQ